MELVAALEAWLCAPEQAELKRAFEAMLARVLKTGAAPEAPPRLEETRAMLETKMAQWEREWQERSEAHGREVGRAEGRAEFLVRLLERRFGALDDAVRARIAAAAPDELLAYADRVLEARTLDAVFLD